MDTDPLHADRRTLQAEVRHNLDAKAAIVESVEAMLDNGSQYLEMMYAAFLRKTSIPAHKVALVELSRGNVTVYKFTTRKAADKLLHAARVSDGRAND